MCHSLVLSLIVRTARLTLLYKQYGTTRSLSGQIGIFIFLLLFAYSRLWNRYGARISLLATGRVKAGG